MLMQLVGLIMTYSFLSQHCKAPHPNLNHVDWDHVILGKKPIKQDRRGWAGLTCFNKLKENISKGTFQKNMLTERPWNWCLSSCIILFLSYCCRSLIGKPNLGKV